MPPEPGHARVSEHRQPGGSCSISRYQRRKVPALTLEYNDCPDCVIVTRHRTVSVLVAAHAFRALHRAAGTAVAGPGNGSLRMLVVISSPTDYPQLDVEQEWTNVRTAVSGLM